MDHSGNARIITSASLVIMFVRHGVAVHSSALGYISSFSEHSQACFSARQPGDVRTQNGNVYGNSSSRCLSYGSPGREFRSGRHCHMVWRAED